jgi:hypothetical protein
MNCIIPIGVEKHEWLEGEMQSGRIGTPRMHEISSETVPTGNTPPWPGLLPCLIFNSTILMRRDLC